MESPLKLIMGAFLSMSYEKNRSGCSGSRLSKTMNGSWMIEQQGKSEGGKEPPSRSINQFFELFQSSKNCLSGAKRLFRSAEARHLPRLTFALRLLKTMKRVG